jgi:hypothetical protein
MFDVRDRMTMARASRLGLLALVLALQGCAVLAVADAAVTVAATAVKVTARAVGAAVDLVTPEGKD